MSLFSDPRWGEALSHLPDYLGNHVRVSITALVLGLLIGLPLAIVARNRPLMRGILLGIAADKMLLESYGVGGWLQWGALLAAAIASPLVCTNALMSGRALPTHAVGHVGLIGALRWIQRARAASLGHDVASVASPTLSSC